MFEIKLGNKTFYYQVFYKNIKNMYLRVKDNRIVVTTRRVPERRIQAFILQHEEKLLKLLDVEKKPLYDKKQALVFGKTYPVETKLSSRNRITFLADRIEISSKDYDVCGSVWEKMYKELTLDKIQKEMEVLKDVVANDIDTSNITFKAQLMKSRFGSCIPKKRVIKLNSILARFDEIYLRMVLLHELIHLEVTGHQKDFYRLMDKYVPDYRVRMKELQKKTREYEV